jgi:O-succinylbenzoic acid--CoA ligase
MRHARWPARARLTEQSRIVARRQAVVPSGRPTCNPPALALICPVNLTTVTVRPLHAVQFPPSAGELMLSALAAALDGSGPAILPLDPALPDAALARMLELFAPAALRTEKGTWPLDRPRAAAESGRMAEDTAVVIATSGSTGQPKAVALSAAALTASASASLARTGAGPGERGLCCLPVFHIAGIGVLVRSLVCGLDPVVTPAVSPEVLGASGCAHVSLVPTQLRRLLAAGAGPGSVKSVLLGGAAAPADLLAQARGAGWRVITTYGMSETCGGCVYDGFPLDGVRVRLSEPGSLIEINGPVLFSGYLGPAPATSGTLSSAGPAAPSRPQPGLQPDGWFRTADLGGWSPGGRLAVRGRADDLINTGGEKVVPGEIEAVLGTCEGVADVVIVGVPDPEWGEAVTAFVIPVDAAVPPDLGRLKSHVRQALSAHAAPRRLVVVSEFPLLPSGKPDRAALRSIGVREA